VGKRRLEGEWALGKMVVKENGAKCWALVGRSLGLGRYAWCCLDIPAIPTFALFQCFPIFQYSRFFDLYTYIYAYIHIHRVTQGCCLSSGYFLLARGVWGGC
jgi:hypothetical protein